MIIEGASTGNKAEVDVDGRVLARSVDKPESVQAAEDSAAWSIDTGTTADTLTNIGGDLLHLQNDSDSAVDIVIDEVVVSADTAGALVKLVRNNAIGTIGAENALAAIGANVANLDHGSTGFPNVTVYSWDETGTGITGLAGGTDFDNAILPVGRSSLGGGMVLRPGNALTLEATLTGEISAIFKFRTIPR